MPSWLYIVYIFAVVVGSLANNVPTSDLSWLLGFPVSMISYWGLTRISERRVRQAQAVRA